jgi:hypothetical protein
MTVKINLYSQSIIKLINTSFFILLFTTISIQTLAQVTDTAVKKTTTFSGSLGLSSNGFSIIPTFSLNSPATMIMLSWKKNKFSIDPDVRLTPDARKGGMLLWFRYHAIKQKKYTMRIGAHPAMNLQTREIAVNGSTSTITQMRRFIAWELSNDYKITKHWGAGVYYLQGNGLQKDGPRTTHFLALNTNVSNIKLAKDVRLGLLSSVYYLYLDKTNGKYVSGSVILSHTKLPFTLQHAFNKTISANIPGNKDYLWNVSVHYNFTKTYRRI